ncbi:MAG: hypothetical protein ACTSU2_05900 [Promethearchaeota archaeon]
MVLKYRDRLAILKNMDDVVLIVDSSGLRVNKYSEWMRKKWGIDSKIHRGFIKVHLAVILCNIIGINGIIIEQSSYNKYSDPNLQLKLAS